MEQHRSIREFKPDPVSDEMVSRIIQAACWASTSNFIQAYSVIRVRDSERRKEIAQLAGPQPWVETSPVFLVFCADLNRAKHACSLEKIDVEAGYTELFIISTVDVSLVAQNVMLAAESNGLGGVFIGGIRNDPETVCRLLEIPEHVYPVYGMCLGYPAETPEQKPRMPLEMILKEEVYREDPSLLEKYNEVCRAYYSSRSKGSRDETWTRQISRMTGKKSRPHMRSFLEKRGFEFK